MPLSLHDLIVGQPAAITPTGLRQALAFAEAMADKGARITLPEVEARLGRKIDGTKSGYMQPNGVAVIPVYGTLMRHLDLMSAMCSDGVTTDSLMDDFNFAVGSPDVKAILFDFDSPGGQVNRITEFAAAIMAARGTKPIVAYASNLCASAAYWLASACDEVVASPTAMLGSIGILAAMPGRDPAKPKDLVYVSSHSPNKHTEPESDAGKAEIMALLDATCEVFLADVAAGRGVSVDHVLEHYGQGGLFIGINGVEAGLADRLGQRDDLIAELGGQAQGPTSALRPAATILRSTGLAASLAARQAPQYVYSLDEGQTWEATMPDVVRADGLTVWAKPIGHGNADATLAALRAYAEGGTNLPLTIDLSAPVARALAEVRGDADTTDPPVVAEPPSPPDDAEPEPSPAEEEEEAPPVESAQPPADAAPIQEDDTDEAQPAPTTEGVAMSGTSLAAQLRAANAAPEIIAQAEALEKQSTSQSTQLESLSASVAQLNRDKLIAQLRDEVTGRSNDGIVWLGAANENVETLLAMCDAFGGLQGERTQKFIVQQRAIAVQAEEVATVEVGSVLPQLEQSAESEQPATAKIEGLVAAYQEANPDATHAGAYDAITRKHKALAQQHYLEQNAARGVETAGVVAFKARPGRGKESR